MLGGSPHFSKPNFKNSPRLALLWQKNCRALGQKGAQLQRWLVKISYANEFVIKVDFSKLQIQTEARIHALGVRAGG